MTCRPPRAPVASGMFGRVSSEGVGVVTGFTSGVATEAWPIIVACSIGSWFDPHGVETRGRRASGEPVNAAIPRSARYNACAQTNRDAPE